MKNHLPCAFPELSFDELSLLASTDPSGFDELRTALISNAIEFSGENSDLLRDLQCRIDEESNTEIPRYLSFLSFSEWINDYYQKLS